MHHPLLDPKHIDDTPQHYLEAVGDVFATFGAPTQDSGNVSYGLQIGDQRFFVKTTDPGIQVLLDYDSRVELLMNAAQLANSCNHPTLPALVNVVESSEGPMLVFEWVDGELLRGKRDDRQSAHQRFRRLPVEEILAALDATFELHVQLADAGWIAVDFYDGSMIYDFGRRQLHIVDLDNYQRGPFKNSMGRMFGSSRFMAPEEFQMGHWINERTTIFTMGRTAAVFLSDASLGREPFRGNGKLHDVVVRACQTRPEERYGSIGDFYEDWRRAR